MEMPQPNDAHRSLHRLAGTWRGKETMHPSPWDPKGSSADGETRSRIALSGFNVVSDYRQSRAGVTAFEGHGVYSIDGATKEVVLHWFDSTGQDREEFRGRWEGDRLTLVSSGPSGGARLLYDFSTAGRLRSSMAMAGEGETWNTLFDGEYERVGA